jgi:hypothetical protein
MDSGILMIQDSILVCSPDPRIQHAVCRKSQKAAKWRKLVKRLAKGTNDIMLKVERTVVGE